MKSTHHASGGESPSPNHLVRPARSARHRLHEQRNRLPARPPARSHVAAGARGAFRSSVTCGTYGRSSMPYPAAPNRAASPATSAPQRRSGQRSHAGPHDPVVPPVLEPIDRQIAAGAAGFRRVPPRSRASRVARHVAEEHQRAMNVALRNRAAAAFAPRVAARSRAARSCTSRGRPHGEETARGEDSASGSGQRPTSDSDRFPIATRG